VDVDDLRRRLSALHQLELDALAAYGVALASAQGREIQEQLLLARDDHRRHIFELKVVLEGLGVGLPPEHLDLKGILWRSMAAAAGRVTLEGAIASVLGGELLTARRYRELRRQTDTFSGLLDRHLEDEERHRAFLEAAIGERPAAPIE
jgi:hypothetical protein